MYGRVFLRCAIAALVWTSGAFAAVVLFTVWRTPNAEVVQVLGSGGYPLGIGALSFMLLMLLTVAVPAGAIFGVLLAGIVRGLVRIGMPRGRILAPLVGAAMGIASAVDWASVVFGLGRSVLQLVVLACVLPFAVACGALVSAESADRT